MFQVCSSSLPVLNVPEYYSKYYLVLLAPLQWLIQVIKDMLCLSFYIHVHCTYGLKEKRYSVQSNYGIVKC